MLDTKYIFNEMSNSYFLYYSWIELKVLYCLSGNINYKPISLTWFVKASRLLREGSYFYHYTKLGNFQRGIFNRFSIVDIRCKVIEGAIFNTIYPYFCTYFVQTKNAILNKMRFTLIL